jgi:hypothetical protein
MTGLPELLDHAAGDAHEADITADLRRGRRALARRRTWWAAGVTGGLAVVGAVAAVDLSQSQTDVATPLPADSPSTPPALVTGQFYDVPQPPAGWHEVGQRAQYVMLTRDGSDVTSIDSGFIGQIVVMLTDGKEHFENQPSQQYDGRTFYVNADTSDPSPDNMATISVRDASGDWLQNQFPVNDFGIHEMIAYLDGVVVKSGAQPGLG